MEYLLIKSGNDRILKRVFFVSERTCVSLSTNKICVWLLFKIAIGRKSGRARFRKIASCRYDLGTSDKEIYGLKYQVPEHLISCECRSLNSRSTLWQKCSWFIEKANNIFLTSLFLAI